MVYLFLNTKFAYFILLSMQKEILKTIIKDFFKLKYPLAMILFILILGTGVVWGNGIVFLNGMKSSANSYERVDLSSFGLGCKQVVNQTGGTAGFTTPVDYFVPTKTVNEWNAFTGNLPAGVSVTDCCTDGYRDSDKDGYGILPYYCYAPSSSYNIVQDSTDCYDSSAEVKPGNTGYNLDCSVPSDCYGFYDDSLNNGNHDCAAPDQAGLWNSGTFLPSGMLLQNVKTLYSISASGVYTPTTITATGGASCGTSYLPAGSSGSWYYYTGSTYQFAVFGQARVFCR